MRKAVILLMGLFLLIESSCGKKEEQEPVNEATGEVAVDVKVKEDIKETRKPRPPKEKEPVAVAEPVIAPPVASPEVPITTTLDPVLFPPIDPGLIAPALPFWGDRYRLIGNVIRPERRHHDSQDDELSWLIYWNEVAIDASGLDHTPMAEGEDRVFGEQIGPGRSSRALAIVQIAVFEAINAIEGGFKSYTNLKKAKGEVSVKAAIAQAAHDTLVELFPSQADLIDEELEKQLKKLKNSDRKDEGIKIGKLAAQSILDLREDDGSETPEPVVGVDYIPPVGPGKWSPDPISMVNKAIGAFWSQVKPFVMTSASQFRAEPPPSLNSQFYTTAFNENIDVGGDGVITPNNRTEDQTDIGIFWAYDGTPSLCAPPRLYNQLVVHIAKQEKTSFIETARLLALINIGMADAGIGGWESKYFYNFWRPVTAIRDAANDGNPNTAADPTFTPLGAPASNLQGPNFTPPFPAYPSGHATFGGVVFEILRKYYKRDNIAFTFVSDELNGITKDNEGNTRPLKPRSYTSLSQAEEENGQSRMYLGIHWEFDKIAGIKQGRKIADLVMLKIYLPTNQ